MVDEVRGEIERIQGYMSSGRLASFDEAAIKATAIEPILSKLGWDVVDPDEVRREYSVGSRSVDYALFCDDTLKVFIEAKRGGESLERQRHQDQLVRYAFDEGVEIAMLTNGATWWFYLPIRAVSWERRKVVTLELNQQDNTEIAQKLVDVLGKESVCSGRAIRNAERHQVLETLPEVWNQLVSEPDSSIVNLLAERTHRLCVRAPARDEVGQFLSGHIEQIQIMPLPTNPAPVPPLEPGPSPGPSSSGSVTGKKLAAFVFNGSRYEVTSWKGMLVKLCEVLHTTHSSQFVKVLNLKGRKRPYFSKNRMDLREPEMIKATKIFVETNFSAKITIQFAHKVIRQFGYDESDLSFETQT